MMSSDQPRAPILCFAPFTPTTCLTTANILEKKAVACLAARAQSPNCLHFLPCGERVGCSRMRRRSSEERHRSSVSDTEAWTPLPLKGATLSSSYPSQLLRRRLTAQQQLSLKVFERPCCCGGGDCAVLSGRVLSGRPGPSSGKWY